MGEGSDRMHEFDSKRRERQGPEKRRSKYKGVHRGTHVVHEVRFRERC